MVREARFSWDEDDPFRPFEQPDRFDDLDDLDLDPLVSKQRLRPTKGTSSSTDPERRTERCKSHKVSPAVPDNHRHLAGANWLGDETEPPWEEN